MKDLKDNRPKGLYSVFDWKLARKKNLKNGYWGCPCGSRKFHLIQQKENVKTICVKCRNMDIIYWNGEKDSSKGRMLRLDTLKWV